MPNVLLKEMRILLLPGRRGLFLLALATLVLPAMAQQRPNAANWPLAERFTSQALRPYIYSSSLTPGFINNTDTFWYSWRGPDGVGFWKVDPAARTRKPLFDSARMAKLLSEAVKKPYDSLTLPITTLTFTEDGKTIRFTVENIRFEYNLDSEELKEVGRVRAGQQQAGAQGGQGRGGGGGQAGQSGQQQDFRNFSPDRKAYVYAQDHNLYFVDVEDEENPIQLTKDGEQHYSFGARAGGQQQRRDEDEQEEDEEQQESRGGRVRASVTWSRDSNKFYVTRMDSRKVSELFLVNSLSNPRPTLRSYKYSMPGEENVAQQELHLFDRDKKELRLLDVGKWKDQRLFNVHWTTGSDVLRFVRRDRLQRNLELCEMNLENDEIKVLITESVQNAFLERQDVRYLKPGGDFIWWSERNGWAHYYLYAHDGTLKNAITSGPWRAHSISAVDADKGLIWVLGHGREAGKNPNYRHLYRVSLDGKNVVHLTPGDMDHSTSLAPSRKFLVDSFSRVDLPPRIVVRDEKGSVLMELEETDVARLKEMGWSMPEPFVVKAADGVTDVYGNMWKPADFDPRKKYPIIAHVYPGPQTESVAGPFSATSNNQRLAQLGFIVVQIGNRGGNPVRSNAYHSYGYFNLRDYALADKKVGIEQLAARHPFIDIDRVGIYGHSGGGFLTAAALLVEPYNDFFKVGVSSAGNHDNNVYNQNWSEQHHGLREVEKDGETTFEIKVPANHELAANLKGKLLLVHGDMDNNVHPAGTIRLVNELIKANKRFDFLLLPGQAHGFGSMSEYFNRLMMEYFAEHLLGDYYRDTADIRRR